MCVCLREFGCGCVLRPHWMGHVTHTHVTQINASCQTCGCASSPPPSRTTYASMPAYTLSLYLSVTNRHRHTRPHTYRHTPPTPTHTHTHTHPPTHPPTHLPTHPHTHTHTQSHALTHTHSLTHTHTGEGLRGGADVVAGVVLHVSINLVTLMNESCHTHKWVMSRR